MRRAGAAWMRPRQCPAAAPFGRAAGDEGLGAVTDRYRGPLCRCTAVSVHRARGQLRSLASLSLERGRRRVVPHGLDAPGFDESVESDERLLLGLGHPDLLQRPLGLRLLAALATRLRPHFFERLPEAQRARVRHAHARCACPAPSRRRAIASSRAKPGDKCP